MADSTVGRKRKKFILSRAVKFDVDPLGKSFRPEFITVHYDRVHNPEHCYHIRLQWLNTTNKFIEDSIIAWSRLCEKHGLKLVETPWKELCILPRLSPFHSFVDVKLSLNPWTDPDLADDEIFSTNKYFYHSYFLKKLGYYLDNRSTSFFLRENIDIGYSWGVPSFRYAQFIHKSGFYIAELRDNGDFFWLQIICTLLELDQPLLWLVIMKVMLKPYIPTHIRLCLLLELLVKMLNF